MNTASWRGGLILNIDINSVNTPFLNEAAEREPFIEETMYPFVDQYADTQVKALSFCIFCQYSATPSKIWSDSLALYDRRMENGVEVRYCDQYQGIYQWYRHGIDPYAVWFRRCRQRGMEAWMSIRMNDCHCPDDVACFIRSDFFYEAREKGWMIGDSYRYYRHCFDYAVPEVRKKMLDYIEEQLYRYDVDGLELDFMREPFCFDYPNCPDKIEIMNGFMGEVNKLRRQAEDFRGHGIKCIVRLPREMEQCLILGFDPETWAKEHWVDHINVTPRWETCDNDMPIRAWKERFPETEISAGIETLCLRNDEGPHHATADVVNGLAAAYSSQGADAIYLFNFYLNPYRNFNMYGINMKEEKERTDTIIRRCGKGETILAAPRRHIITYQDIAPKGCVRYRPLPLPLKANEPQNISLPIGYVPGGRAAKLILGFSEGNPEKCRIFCNGKACGEWNPCKVMALEDNLDPTDAGYTRSNVKIFACNVAAESLERYQIVLEAAEDAVLNYVEVDIRPQ